MSYAVYGHPGGSPTRRAYDLFDPGAPYGNVAPPSSELQQQYQPLQPRGYGAYSHDGAPANGYAEPPYAHHHHAVSDPGSHGGGIALDVAPHERGRLVSPSTIHTPDLRGQHQVASPVQMPHHRHPGEYYAAYAEPHASPYLAGPTDDNMLQYRQNSSENHHMPLQHQPHSPYAPHTPVPPPAPMPIRASSGLAVPSVHARDAQASPPQPQPVPPPPPASYGPSLKVLQWTPQRGEADTQVTIILEATAIRNARPSPFTGAPGSFGPPGMSVHDPRAVGANRRFVVAFGQAPAATQFMRAQVIDGNGVGQSMSAGPNEEDAFVVLTTFVPPRSRMGAPSERVMVVVKTVDVDSDACIESCIVGEWDPQTVYSATPQQPTTPRLHTLKRTGEELYSPRTNGPGSHRSASEVVHGTTIRQQSDWHGRSPVLSRDSATPAVPSGSGSQANGYGQVPNDAKAANDHGGQSAARSATSSSQPQLVRTSQLASSKNSTGATYSHKVVLKMQGDLNLMAMGWSNEEWTARRRLVQFWPQQDGNVLNLAFRPIAQHEYVANTIVVSCIFRDEWNECFVTSVDTIYLLEALVGARFSVEEKNRIRRNLEGFKPMTVSKSKADAEPFFKLIMGFPNPKPRNIEKDVKVFPWKALSQALKKVMSKYSANYPLGADGAATASREAPNSPPAPATSGVQPPSRAHSPHITHTEPSPQLGAISPRPLQASPRSIATVPGSPFLSPPAPNGGGSSAHAGGFRSAPQSPYGSHSFRPPSLEEAAYGSVLALDVPYSSNKSLSLLAAPLPLAGVSGRRKSSFARPAQQTHLFPAAEDYGILASYLQQPQLYSANPLYEHQDARSENGLGPSSISLPGPVSHAHLRSVSEGLQLYPQSPQPLTNSGDMEDLTPLTGLSGAELDGESLDIRSGGLDGLSSRSQTHLPSSSALDIDSASQPGPE
ncbi:hypothetical protein JCM10908_006176 [Rhodotorula pacifica]|uniref:uncharacterized protein n=1 Tax=Rhodotorula pacifica TaxID=1495444 RepID=UPI003177AA42